MMRISTFTTRYDGREDRICLTAMSVDGNVCNLWLTRKIASALAVALLKELDKSVSRYTDEGQLQAAHVYFQLEARVSKKSAAPLRMNHLATQVLVDTVHIRWHKKDLVVLELCSLELEPTQLIMNPHELRQWIEAVRGSFSKAEWNDLDWPAWIAAN